MMQDLTVVYRYGEDRYLLAADGGLIDTYRDRASAEHDAAVIRMLNLSGYLVRGENPRMTPGYQYGRIFVEAAIGPRIPNAYTLAPHYADQLANMDAPRDVMGRALDFLTMPYALIDELRQLDPDDRGLLYSVERNDSAGAFRDLILVARGDDRPLHALHNYQPRHVHPDNLAAWISNIADDCKDDGAERGTIPLIAGQTRAVWVALYRWYLARSRPGMGAARVAARVSF